MSKFVVGITGGIASGKTTVSDMLASFGARVIDADIISREVIATGTDGEKMLKKAFPKAYKTGELNRVVLREIVFSSDVEREKLNAITHPLVEKEIIRLIENATETVYVVVPLLFETGYDKYCDYIVTVTANEGERIRRLKLRNNTINDDVARKIIASQCCDDERVKRSDEVIVNDGEIGEIEKKVRKLYEDMKTRSK